MIVIPKQTEISWTYTRSYIYPFAFQRFQIAFIFSVIFSNCISWKPRPILFSGLNTLCRPISITRIATYSGWTSKPTPRSDTARLRSNVLKVLGNDNVFLIACIVMMFNTMVVKHKKALKTQLNIKCQMHAFSTNHLLQRTLISVQFQLRCFGGIIRFRMRLTFSFRHWMESFIPS